ncbi:plastocyanin/azurin family copper-binding protein [Rhodothermus bifroesti]|nr:Auracyanin-A [bacterium HR18]
MELVMRYFLSMLLVIGWAAQAEPVKEIVIEPVGDELKFKQTEFTVQPGETVRLIFKNTAKVMPHNVVVLNTSSPAVVNRVGTAAITAKDYVPDDPAILAYTKLAQPGETVEVTFKAPATPGRYRYICTFPGHFSMMQGTMVVAPKPAS